MFRRDLHGVVLLMLIALGIDVLLISHRRRGRDRVRSDFAFHLKLRHRRAGSVASNRDLTRLRRRHRRRRILPPPSRLGRWLGSVLRHRGRALLKDEILFRLLPLGGTSSKHGGGNEQRTPTDNPIHGSFPTRRDASLEV